MTYFGDKEYYFDDGNAVSRNVKLKKKAKFMPKALVWIAISSRGRSQPFIFHDPFHDNPHELLGMIFFMMSSIQDVYKICTKKTTEGFL